MMNQPLQSVPVTHGKRQNPWPRRVAVSTAIIIALLVGVGIGVASHSQTGALNKADATLASANRHLAAERATNTSLSSEVATLRSQYSTAKNQASHAMRIASAKARAAWSDRNAALKVRSDELNQRAAALRRAEGMIQSSRISSDGVYVVGRDIKPGTWHTSGDGGQTDNECYFATLGSTDTSNILDNNNFDGPETVSLSGAYAFQISGPCTWTRIGG